MKKLNYKEWTKKDIKRFQNRLIISGDTIDGIPNILSEGDTFVKEHKRQRSIAKSKIAEWQDEESLDNFFKHSSYSEYYERNKTLIDFSGIPENIALNILNEFEKAPKAPMMKFMQYLGNFPRLLDKIEEF